MIPRHVIVTNHTRPEDYLARLAGWNPGFKIIFFDDMQCEGFIEEHFEQRVLQAYRDIRPGAYKADIFRYCAMYLLGGVYSDIYIPYQRSFESLWDLSSNYLFLIQDTGMVDSIQISTMAAPPKSRFFQLCLEKAVSNIEQHAYCHSPYAVTGPELAGACLKSYLGRDSFEFAQVYPSAFEEEAVVSLDYRVVWLSGEAKQKVSQTAIIDKTHNVVFPYKLNINRGNWQNPTHYYNAWHARAIYPAT